MAGGAWEARHQSTLSARQWWPHGAMSSGHSQLDSDSMEAGEEWHLLPRQKKQARTWQGGAVEQAGVTVKGVGKF